MNARRMSRTLRAALLALTTCVMLTLVASAGAGEPTVTEFTAGITSGAGPNAIAAGPDGDMYFTEYEGDEIGRVTQEGTISELPTTGTQLSSGAHPSGIVTGPDGDLWFGEYGTGKIGELDPSSGELIGEYTIPNGPNSGPDGIVSGPEGDLWFTEQEEGEIGRIDPVTHEIVQFPIHQHASESFKPSSLAVGPEGDLWFTLTGTGQVGRLVPSEATAETDDGVTLYDLPSGGIGEPEGIATGPEGNLYVAEYGSAKIARIEPGEVSSGTEKGIAEFAVGGKPLLATAAKDGGIWFSDNTAELLIRFDPKAPTSPTYVNGANGLTGDTTGIAEDGKGHLWFTQFQSPSVGRLSLEASAPIGPVTPIVVPPKIAEPSPKPIPKLEIIEGGKIPPIFTGSSSSGNGSPITGYKLKIAGDGESSEIECGAKAPVAAPEFSKTLSGTATLTVTDADGESSSTTSSFTNPIPIPTLAHPPGKARSSGLSPVVIPIVPDYKCLPPGGESEAAAIGAAGVVSSSCETVAGILRIEGCALKRVEGLCSVPTPERALIERHLIPGEAAKKIVGCGGAKALFASTRRAHSASSVSGSLGSTVSLLESLQDSFFVAKDAIRVNGITVTPEHGGSLAVPVGGLISTSFAKEYAAYLESTNASVKIGGFPLGYGKLDLDVSGIGSAEAKFAEFNLKSPVGFGQFAKLALGYFLGGVPALPIEGGFKATFVKDGKTRLDINLELNKLISDGLLDENNLFTGATSVETSNEKGLELDSLDIEVPELPVPGAPFSFKPIDLHYNREKEFFAGTLGIDFGEGSINASVAFEHGLFREGAAQYLADKGYGFDVAGPVFLIELGAKFTLFQEANPGSTTSLSGNATLSLGPALSDNGCGFIDVVGNAEVNLGPGPFSISTDAEQRIFCIPLKKTYFTVNAEGYVELGSSEEFNIPDIGSLYTNEDGQAYASAAKGQFHIQLDGSGKATIDGVGSVGVETIISDKGIGACAEIGYPGGSWRPGIGESFVPLPLTAAQFFANLSISFDGCDLSKYQSVGPAGPSGAAASAAASGYSFDVPASEKTAVVKLTGQGGAPTATLTGPGSRKIDTTANSSSAEQLVLRQASTDTTLVMIRGAKTGHWSIAADAGSVPLTAVATAHELPRPKVTARLTRKGAERVLRYSIAPQPGMQVSFEEVGKNGGQMLGTAHGSHGTIAFLPSGASGKRSIVAVVTENGAPRADIKVASFSSAPPKPGRTSDIRVKRSHGGLLISFRPAPLATGTVVAVRLSEGRSAILEARGRGRSVLVPEVPPTSKPTRIVVRALRGAVRGPAVRPRKL